LRYRPDGADFVIENGAEFFNRPLYGGNTAFRVDGGDRPEFVLYLPGRGGNVRLAVRTPAGALWLHRAAASATRYRPGELLYELRDPLLGPAGVVRVTAVAYAAVEGLGVQVTAENAPPGAELVVVYGGLNGQRGTRDGDIGTERVPISEWFQLQPEFCRDNQFTVTDTGFRLEARAATIVGTSTAAVQWQLAEAAAWNDLPRLLAPAGATPALPVIVGRTALARTAPVYFSWQRVGSAA